MEVSKEITICTAHMLSGHNGRCKNLHGHNYKVCVTLVGDQRGEPKNSDSKMVMDFGDLKSAMEETIDKTFDHALVISSAAFRGEAEAALLNWAIAYGMRHYVMPEGYRSTAEDMASAMAKRLLDSLGNNRVASVRVALWETPTSCATAEAKR